MNVVAAGLAGSTLALHSALTIFLPYTHNRLRSHALSNAWPDAPSSDRRRKAWELLTRLESIHGFAALLNFLLFLWNGRLAPGSHRKFQYTELNSQIPNISG